MLPAHAEYVLRVVTPLDTHKYFITNSTKQKPLPWLRTGAGATRADTIDRYHIMQATRIILQRHDFFNKKENLPVS